MRERPILFKGEMVRAILDGRKTMTRRLVKNCEVLLDPPKGEGTKPFMGTNFGTDSVEWCPYGVPGDRLWVKEIFLVETSGSCRYDAEGLSAGEYPDWLQRASIVHYKATTDLKTLGAWKSSLFMPRWASRITLEIVSVNVERLNDITEEDAEREGVKPIVTHRNAFAILWDSINGKTAGASWEADPWVWVIEFKRVKP